MGGGGWSQKAYDDATVSRAVSKAPTFKHTADIAAGKVAVSAHGDLDPRRVAGPKSPFKGKMIRESRDSDEHPASLPVVVFFDVTGSMGEIPKVMQAKLGKLMDVVKDKGGVGHPQVLIGAIGDGPNDRVPFQVGQFESDNRFDEQLRNIYIEGDGGGQRMESYALAYEWASYHSEHDAYDKRGKRGYLFTIGDEAPHPSVTKADRQKVWGEAGGEAESVESLAKRAQEKYEVFHLRVDGSYPPGTHDGDVIDKRWKQVLGERVVHVADPALICEVIAGIIHMIEGSHDLDKVVKDIGVKGADAKVVSNALVSIAKTVLPQQAVNAGNLPAKHGSAKGTTSRV